MPRFKYNLQRVLDVWTMRERIRQNELALERKKELEVLKKIEHLRTDQSEEYTRGQAVMAQSVPDVRVYLNYQRYMEALERAIARSYQDLDQQRKNVEAARQTLIEASRKKKLLEKLRDKRLTEFKKQEEAAEQKIIDEIGGTLSTRLPARQIGMES